MNETSFVDLAAPRIEDREPMLVAGLRERYTQITRVTIPAQWERFGGYVGRIPGEITDAVYGVVSDMDGDGSFGYLTGVRVRGLSGIPEEFDHIRIPGQRYAIFRHGGNIAEIGLVWQAIHGRWLPESGHALATAPVIERYGPNFDPVTGDGGFELWAPLA